MTGHLYYDDALWLDWTSVPPFYSSYTTVSGVSFQQGHAPLASRTNDIRLSNWDVANWIWAPRTDIWANGDGVFMYPGAPIGNVGVPVSTIRFEAQRDGVEDWHVMKAAATSGHSAEVASIVKSQVSAPTVWSDNTTLLEENRVRLLTLASSNTAASKKSGIQFLTCGSVLENNGTWISSDLDDYFATVNSSGPFTLIAENWGIDPSSPACDPAVTVTFAPDGTGSYAPEEHEFGDGDSFNMTVPPSDPPSTQFDLIFSGGLCDYFVRMRRLMIVC